MNLGNCVKRGDFGSFEDLRQLDQHAIDVVIHLAAVTGGCLERDGLLVNMEEVTRYYQRQEETLNVINLRLSSVRPDENPGQPAGVRPLGPWALGGITVMVLADAVRAFTLAAEAPYKPGGRILNATAARAWASAPTAAVLRNWWGDVVDLRYFEQPGNEYAAAYDVSAIERELGFTAAATVQLLTQ